MKINVSNNKIMTIEENEKIKMKWKQKESEQIHTIIFNKKYNG